MGWDNPPMPWRELERRLSWGTAARPAADGGQRADGGQAAEPPPRPVTRLPAASRDGPEWAELHCHSSYSFLDGASAPATASGGCPSPRSAAPPLRVCRLSSQGPARSVVSGLDQPAAVLHRHQPRRPVLGDQLESGPSARGARIPPSFGDRPRPGPGGDHQPRGAVGRHPGGRRGDQAPPADGHRGAGAVGDPGRQRGRVDRGRLPSGGGIRAPRAGGPDSSWSPRTGRPGWWPCRRAAG